MFYVVGHDFSVAKEWILSLFTFFWFIFSILSKVHSSRENELYFVIVN